MNDGAFRGHGIQSFGVVARRGIATLIHLASPWHSGSNTSWLLSPVSHTLDAQLPYRNYFIYLFVISVHGKLTISKKMYTIYFNELKLI